MANVILINSVTYSVGSGALPVPAGEVFVAGTPQAIAIAAAGGILLPSDASLLAAAAIVQKLRLNHGANEEEVTRIMLAAATGDIYATAAAAFAAKPTRVSTAIPLATIQAQTSGAAFNVGPALPANARLLAADIVITTPITGGTISAVAATVQATGETAGAILASASVFTGAASPVAKPGSNPAASRGGQQLQMTLTATGDTLANATAGALALEVFYTVIL